MAFMHFSNDLTYDATNSIYTQEAYFAIPTEYYVVNYTFETTSLPMIDLVRRTEKTDNGENGSQIPLMNKDVQHVTVGKQEETEAFKATYMQFRAGVDKAIANGNVIVTEESIIAELQKSLEEKKKINDEIEQRRLAKIKQQDDERHEAERKAREALSNLHIEQAAKQVPAVVTGAIKKLRRKW